MSRVAFSWIAALALSVLPSAWLSSTANAQTSAAPFQTGYRWDVERRLVGKISPYPDDGNTTYYPAERYSYNADGQLVSVETGILSAWQSQSVMPSAWTGFTVRKTVTYSYDAAGNQTEERVSAAGAVQSVTQMTSDADDRLMCSAVRMNLSEIPATGSNACAQGSGNKDRITRTLYDTASQVRQIRRGVGTPIEQANVTYSYTPNGKKEYIVDANGNKARFAYDGFDRHRYWFFPSPVRPSSFDGSTPASALATAGDNSTSDFELYGYDVSDNRSSIRKRDGRSITFAYDAVNRMLIKNLPDTTSGDIFYSYDPRGLQLTARFGSQTGSGITNTYDKAGRLKSSADNVGGVNQVLVNSYDANGNRERLDYPDYDGTNNRYVLFEFDGLDRMSVIRQGVASGSPPLVASFVYNNEGERACWYANVMAACDSGTANRTGYSYDALGRLASITLDLGGTAQDVTYCMGTLSGSCVAAYNPASQLLARSISNDLYAVRGRLNAARSYIVNGLNQYVKAGNFNPSYDDNGNLTAFEGTAYRYDPENRLISAAGSTSATLTYDPLGRLNSTVSGGATTRFLYDGDELVAEYDSAGTLLRRYVHGPNTNEPVLWYEGPSMSTRRVLRADHQGSIVSVAESAGTSIAINSYDEWGNPGPDNVGRFAYTGQIVLPELGLYHYKARVYSPRLGRFLQTDPVGYDDQINLYAYVANDPINNSDPSGQELIAGAIGAIAGGVLGVGGQALEDWSSGSVSGLGDYLGAGVGGAVSGGVLGLTGSPTFAGAAGGSVGNLVKQGVAVANGEQAGINGTEVLKSGAVGAAFGRATAAVPGLRVQGVTAGRNSFGAVAKAASTKFSRGSISRVSGKTIAKGVTAGVVGGATGTVAESATKGGASRGMDAMRSAIPSVRIPAPQLPRINCINKVCS